MTDRNGTADDNGTRNYWIGPIEIGEVPPSLLPPAQTDPYRWMPPLVYMALGFALLGLLNSHRLAGRVSALEHPKPQTTMEAPHAGN